MTQQDKIKLGGAIALLVIAFFLIYWFGFHTPSSTIPTTGLTPAPVVQTNDPNAPPPAANKRMPPGSPGAK